ncbi:cyclic nucleotide-binding domain-containing protein [Legionella maioricensis]|uniref:Cyclic nucleotide-binding domain-containing protein n=1 Tax=Legionella maioricensis TaxID=2896528 RepID=A0A9X2CXL3_9GAMM|nr:cyclic nucleotide-binding domain-containing protein [Legionella maioricensis]MCL9682719.1 cyclic nucleotide-binding domain-containing protein [Legionella maioricensis]MCL9687233.1 cyclic nucleotide-binding domain-containing protein [Legionella maioricensis]
MMEIDNSTDSIVEALQKSALFGSLSSKQLEQIIPLFKITSYDANEIIINENDIPIDLYVIREGTVEVLKKSGSGTLLRISVLHAGEVIGEMGLLDNSPRSASIRTLSPTKLLSVSIADLKTLANEGFLYNQIITKLTDLVKDLRLSMSERPIYFTLISNLANTLSGRMRQTNQVTVESLKSELELSKARVAMGKFMINLLFVLAVYMYAFKIIEKMANNSLSTSVISIPLIIFFAMAVLMMMKSSGYSMQFYGLTTSNWRQSLKDSVIVSIILISCIAFIKWLSINLIPQFHDLTLIHLSFNAGGMQTTNELGQTNIPILITLIFAYLVFTPIQELICRGALQSSLQEFLTGPSRVWWAIIISNILFSVTHLHVSIGLALSVLLPGLFWGWMYARNKTLIGVSLSHLIVGGMAFFVFDIKSILIF